MAVAQTLSQQNPLLLAMQDPKRLAALAQDVDPALGMLMLQQMQQSAQAPTFMQPPAPDYAGMVNPQGGPVPAAGVGMGAENSFDTGAMAQAVGAGPAAAASGGVPWLAMLGLASQVAGQQRAPQIGQAYAVAPQNMWKGFQAKPFEAPAQRARPGALSQILGGR